MASATEIAKKVGKGIKHEFSEDLPYAVMNSFIGVIAFPCFKASAGFRRNPVYEFTREAIEGKAFATAAVYGFYETACYVPCYAPFRALRKGYDSAKAFRKK